jgi:hypothetical protein
LRLPFPILNVGVSDHQASAPGGEPGIVGVAGNEALVDHAAAPALQP